MKGPAACQTEFLHLHTAGQGTCHLHNPTHAEHMLLMIPTSSLARKCGQSPGCSTPATLTVMFTPAASLANSSSSSNMVQRVTSSSHHRLELVSTVCSILSMYRMIDHAHHKQSLHCCSSACGHTTGQFRQMTGGWWPQKLHIHSQSPLTDWLASGNLSLFLVSRPRLYFVTAMSP